MNFDEHPKNNKMKKRKKDIVLHLSLRFPLSWSQFFFEKKKDAQGCWCQLRFGEWKGDTICLSIFSNFRIFETYFLDSHWNEIVKFWQQLTSSKHEISAKQRVSWRQSTLLQHVFWKTLTPSSLSHQHYYQNHRQLTANTICILFIRFFHERFFLNKKASPVRYRQPDVLYGSVWYL